ncbi:MAG: hypothetical protein ABIK83_03180 [Candidatus Zixiibacteriota bacterium]
MELGTLVALVLTLLIFSFLYRENPFYRFAEYLLVGISVGYYLVIISRNTIYPLVINKLFLRGEMIVLVPVILGLMMFARLNRRWAYMSRLPLSLMIGFGAGISIPAMLQARILKQMSASMQSLFTINGIIILVGIVTTTAYFFFSRKQEGFYGEFTKLGTYFLMVFFGATFGYTVMSRISLLIGRLEFILRDAIGLIS